jgi:PAS domain S-box-containing protein
MNQIESNSRNQPSALQWFPQAVGLALVALAYWLAVRAGLLLVAHPEEVASVWPASGLALAALLLSPKRQWRNLLAVIFIVNAAGNYWSGGNSLLLSLGFALANTLEPLLAAWVLTYFCGSNITFKRTAEIFTLFGVAVFCNGITALLGASMPALARGAPYWNTWFLWWTSDGLGMILLAPLIVTWATGQDFLRAISPRRVIEAMLLILGLVAFAWLLFGNFTIAEQPNLRTYMLFPIMIWLAFRYAPRGMASALALVAFIAVWNTLQGYGIFALAAQTKTQHLLSLQLFLMVTVFSGLFLSAIITERRQVEEDLYAKTEELDHYFASSLDLFCIADADGYFRRLNPQWETTLGYPLADLVGKQFLDFVHPDDVEVTRAVTRQSAQENILSFENRYRCKDGSYRWIEWKSMPAGKLIYAAARDITERKQIESQKEIALAALYEKTDQLFKTSFDLNFILDNAPFGISKIVDRKQVLVNRMMETMFQYSKKEMEFQTTRMLYPSDEAYEKLGKDAYQALAQGAVYETEQELIRKDGVHIQVRYVGKALEPQDMSKGTIWVLEDITERKQAESQREAALEKLRESELIKSELLEKLGESQHSAKLGSWEWNMVTNEVWWSDELYNIFELDRGTFKPSVEANAKYVHPEDNEAYHAEVNRVIQTGEELNYDLRIITANEKLKYCNSRAKLQCDSFGKPIRFYGTFADITERKQAESQREAALEKLRESEEKYRTVADFTYDWEAWHAPYGAYLYVSPSCERITGYTVDEFLMDANLVVKITHPDDQPKMVEHFHSVTHQAKMEDVQLDFRIIRRNGEIRWISHHCTAVHDENGKWLGRRESNRDITERKYAEDALRESEARAQAMFRAIPDLMFRMDRQGVFLDFKADIRDLYAQSNIIGKRNRDIAPPEFADLIDRQIRATLETGELQVFEYQLPIPERGVRDYEARMTVSGTDEVTAIVRDITERKQAEEALHESEERYHRITEAITDYIYTVRVADGRIVETKHGPGCLAVTGYQVDEFARDPFLWLRMVVDEDRPAVEEQARRILTGEDSPSIEHRIVHKNGSVRWVKNAFVSHRDGRGNLISYDGLIQDITERKQAEMALLDSEAKFRNIIDLSPVPYALNDNKQNIIYLNAAFIKTFGYDLKDIPVLTNWWSAAYPDPDYRRWVAETWQARLDQANAQGTGFEPLEVNIRCKDGSIKTVLAGAGALGESFHGVHLVILYDITERKQVEDALRDSESALKQAQRVAHVGSWVWHIKDNRLEWSDEMYRIFGYEKENFTGNLADVIGQAIHPDDRAEVERSNTSVMRDRKPIPVEYRVVHPDKTVRTVWGEAGQLILDEQGNPAILTGIVQDITERKRAEDEIRLLNASLERRVVERTQELLDAQEKLVRNEKLAALGQMAGSVGHELRNPLGVMSNAVYFLKMVLPDAPDKVKDYLNLIENNIHISDKIVGDLLDFTRVKSLARAPVFVPDLIRQTLERFPVPENVQVELDLPADLPQAFADPQHVIQILGNLTLNACQAMSSGGKLTVSSKQLSVDTGRWILITVRDTGTGISPENMKKIFEPLFTTKPKGIGFGLAVSKKLIEANGGRIEVESEVGVGSTFTLYLPLYIPSK